MSMDMPALPYAGTEGHSGTDTSEARAEREVLTASHRQSMAVALAIRGRQHGVTVHELREVIPHHGSASSTLSVLHQEGRLLRLKAARDGCKIYVVPEFVGDQPHEKFIGNTEKAQIKVLEEVVEDLRKAWRHADPAVRDGILTAAVLIKQKIRSIQG